MYNQVTAISQCLTKVHDSMVTQLKVLQSDRAKAKSFSKTGDAVDELDFLITFNRSISQVMARIIQNLSEGVFTIWLT